MADPCYQQGASSWENLDWRARVLQTLSLCKSDAPPAQGSMRSSADTLSSLQGTEGHHGSVLQPTKHGLGPSLHFIRDKSESEVAQSCLILWDPMDCSPPGSYIHGIFQARIQEWVAISFSRRSSRPRDWTQVSLIVGRCFTIWATREQKTKTKSKHTQKAFLSARDLSEDFGEGRGQQAWQRQTGNWKREHPGSHPPPLGRLSSHLFPGLTSAFWLLSFSPSFLIRNETSRSGPLFLIKRLPPLWTPQCRLTPGLTALEGPTRRRPQGTHCHTRGAGVHCGRKTCLFSLLIQGCHVGAVLYETVRPKSLQSCPALCDPMPGSSVHGMLQARTLEWVAMPCSRGSHSLLTEETLWRLTWSRSCTKPWRADPLWNQGAQGPGGHSDRWSSPGCQQQQGRKKQGEEPEEAPPQLNVRGGQARKGSTQPTRRRRTCPVWGPADPVHHSTPGLPVHHQLLESTQTHIHWVSDAIQPSHPLSSPSPAALNLSQPQGLF